MDNDAPTEAVVFHAPGEKRAGRKDVKYRWLVVGEDTGGAFTMVDSVVPPGRGSGMHRHRRTNEAIYVLEGELTFLAGERTMHATRGSFVYVPCGVVHEFENQGVGPARMLVVISPSGFEEVYEELTELYRTGQPDAATIQDVCLRHDLEMVDSP
jgi:quercetin dioxygenase-like cupin family protein